MKRLVMLIAILFVSHTIMGCEAGAALEEEPPCVGEKQCNNTQPCDSPPCDQSTDTEKGTDPIMEEKDCTHILKRCLPSEASKVLITTVCETIESECLEIMANAYNQSGCGSQCAVPIPGLAAACRFEPCIKTINILHLYVSTPCAYCEETCAPQDTQACCGEHICSFDSCGHNEGIQTQCKSGCANGTCNSEHSDRDPSSETTDGKNEPEQGT